VEIRAREAIPASLIGWATLGLFRPRQDGGGYRVPWDKLDLSDPEEAGFPDERVNGAHGALR